MTDSTLTLPSHQQQLNAIQNNTETVTEEKKKEKKFEEGVGIQIGDFIRVLWTAFVDIALAL